MYKDVVWLVDVSSSVTASEHELVKTFIYNVTTYLTIGSSDVKMAIVTFDVETNAEFELDDYDAKDELLSAIDAIPEKSNPVSGRKTMDALTYTKTLFLSFKGGRNNAEKTVIVIVDGTSTDTSETISKANELRTNYGAEVFAIGIGPNLTSTNIELIGIANDPDSYYLEYIGGFVNLCGIIPSIVPKIDNETSASLGDGCVVWQETGHDTTVTTINEGLSTYAIVGILLACLFTVALIALLLFLLYRREKNKEKKEELKREESVLEAVKDYKDTGLGEKRYIFKRDNTNTTIHSTKPIFQDTSLTSVYENLGERSTTSSVINLKMTA